MRSYHLTSLRQQMGGVDSLDGHIVPVVQQQHQAEVREHNALQNHNRDTQQQAKNKVVVDSLAQNRTNNLAQRKAHIVESTAMDQAIGASTEIAEVHLDSLVEIATPPHSPTTEQTLIWFRQGPLRQLLDEQAHPRYRTVESSLELFGPQTTVVKEWHIETTNAQDTSSNFAYQGLVLLLAITYIILLYNHLGDVVQLLGSLFRTRIGGDRFDDEPGSSGLSQFLNVSGAIGMLFMGVTTIKAGEVLYPGLWRVLMPEQLLVMLGDGFVPMLILLAIVLLWVVVLYQNSMLRLVGAITLSDSFTKQLLHIKRVYFVVLSIVAIPTLLLLALSPPNSGEGWFWVLFGQSAITVLLYLVETLNLFIAKKVSTLHWFLYLCIVEIFPLSLLWLVAIR